MRAEIDFLVCTVMVTVYRYTSSGNQTKCHTHFIRGCDQSKIKTENLKYW
jgi:hypothetical protein